MSKRFHVTLVGATGVTGRNAYDYLAKNGPADLVWNIAGRNKDKLKKILDRGDETWNKPDVTIVDLDNHDQVEAMIRNTNVLIHLAGPYAEHGEYIIAKCIEHKTDYVDIGGETFFIREMILKYHELAREQGVRVIPTAGYESLPFDMLTMMTVRRMKEVYDETCSKVKIVTSFHRSGSMRDNKISAGSIGTMRNILAGDHIGAFNDVSCLLPDSCDRKGIRRSNKIKYAARYDEDVRAYTGPLQPAPFLNVPVILRSAHLQNEAGRGYGEQFRYSDSMTMEWYSSSEAGQRKAAKKSALKNKLTSVIMGGPKIFRSLIEQRLDAMGIQAGDGPSEDSLPFVDYELRLFATAGSGRKMTATASGKGHPGYLSTARIAAEVGLALSFDESRDDQQCGIVTPSTGLGGSFISRLKNAGVEVSFD
ncbi:MAG: saccharopine dehydrogenase NADP-binding domain-containing protein [Woeseiaceae bacterium]|nr:saccharopine dehydrogenase NADP-binding domain-containing protein [Woeseiaceae bacterium]